MTNEDKEVAKFVVRVLAPILVGVTALFAWGCPQYKVYTEHQEGRAELARAEYNRQIAVQEAVAKREAAKSLAEAEIERARGVAQANQIIGESLKGNSEYLRYLWISGLEHQQHSIVYVPTEAGLPILEAGRGRDLSPTTPNVKPQSKGATP